MVVNLRTMVDYVVPALLNDPSVQVLDVIAKLEAAGSSRPDVVNAVVKYLISQNNLIAAVELCKFYCLHFSDSSNSVTISSQDSAVSILACNSNNLCECSQELQGIFN